MQYERREVSTLLTSQSQPGWAADWTCSVELCENQSLTGKFVDDWSGGRWVAIAGKISKPKLRIAITNESVSSLRVRTYG